MWGQNWGTLMWGQAASAPAMGFWGALLLGAVLGVIGARGLRGTRPRTLGIVGVALAVLIPIAARAVPPYSFTNGTVANATQVNTNFTAAGQLNQSGGYAEHAFAVGNTRFCGNTSSSVNGTLGLGLGTGGATAWANAKISCEGVTGCSQTAHMCSGEELARSLQAGFGVGGGWYSGARDAVSTTGVEINDCQGWTSNSSALGGSMWNIVGAPNNITAIYPSFDTCNNTHIILCCDAQPFPGP
jgi:hypothetical protein